MKYISKFINEKLKLSKKRVSDNGRCIVIFSEFLMWLFDINDESELSLDLINDRCDQLYAIEQYYICSRKEAYNFLMSYKDEEVEIETKKSRGEYEFLIKLPKGKFFDYSWNKKDILLRFYKNIDIPEDIKL